MSLHETSSEYLNIKAADGYTIPLNHYKSVNNAKAAVFFAPALGMEQKYYDNFCARLALEGYEVFAQEQRGHGRSQARPSWFCNYGYRDLVETDFAACVNYVKERCPSIPLLLAGHSLGGQFGAMYASAFPEGIAGLILISVASPQHWRFPDRRGKLLNLSRLVFPMSNLVFGYHNGKFWGLGGRESRRLILDWRIICGHNTWQPKGSKINYERAFRRATLPILNIQMERDYFVTAEAEEGFFEKFTNAKLSRMRIPLDEETSSKKAHFNWAKEPELVVAAIDRWQQVLIASRLAA